LSLLFVRIEIWKFGGVLHDDSIRRYFLKIGGGVFGLCPGRSSTENSSNKKGG